MPCGQRPPAAARGVRAAGSPGAAVHSHQRVPARGLAPWACAIQAGGFSSGGRLSPAAPQRQLEVRCQPSRPLFAGALALDTRANPGLGRPACSLPPWGPGGREGAFETYKLCSSWPAYQASRSTQTSVGSRIDQSVVTSSVSFLTSPHGAPAHPPIPRRARGAVGQAERRFVHVNNARAAPYAARVLVWNPRTHGSILPSSTQHLWHSQQESRTVTGMRYEPPLPASGPLGCGTHLAVHCLLCFMKMQRPRPFPG